MVLPVVNNPLQFKLSLPGQRLWCSDGTATAATASQHQQTTTTTSHTSNSSSCIVMSASTSSLRLLASGLPCTSASNSGSKLVVTTASASTRHRLLRRHMAYRSSIPLRFQSTALLQQHSSTTNTTPDTSAGQRQQSSLAVNAVRNSNDTLNDATSSPMAATAMFNSNPTETANAKPAGDNPVSTQQSTSQSAVTSTSNSLYSQPQPTQQSTQPPFSGSSFRNNRMPLFNTYRLVEELRRSGMTEQQGVIIMECLSTAVHESIVAQQEQLATKTDFSSLKVELQEKVFNASLKYDLQQKHLREMFRSELDAVRNDMLNAAKSQESDFRAFKSDIGMNFKTELFGIQQTISRIEKEVESDKSYFASEQEKLENRLIKYALGFVASFGALTLTTIRLFGGLGGGGGGLTPGKRARKTTPVVAPSDIDPYELEYAIAGNERFANPHPLLRDGSDVVIPPMLK